MKRDPLDAGDSHHEMLPVRAVVNEAETSLVRTLAKLGVLAVMILVAMTLIHNTSFRETIVDLQTWKSKIAATGWLGIAGFGLASMIGIALGLPRLFMAGLAGALLGFKVGFPLAWLSALGGAWLNFAAVRWGARDSCRRWIKLPPRMEPLLRRPGFLTVVVMRQLPLWGLVVNASLAVTEIPHRIFASGTLVGTLPSALVVTLLGSGLGKSELHDSLRNVIWALVLVVLFVGILWTWHRQRPSDTPTVTPPKS